MHPSFQLAGSLLILVPFVLVQTRRMTPSAVPYVALNLAGSTMLAVDAAVGRQWGFLLLEGVWALVSAGALVTALLRRSRTNAGTGSDAGATGSEAGATTSDAGATTSEAGATTSDAGATGSDAGATTSGAATS